MLTKIILRIEELFNIDGNMISSARFENGSAKYYAYNKDTRNSTSTIVGDDNIGSVAYKYDEFGGTEVLGNATFENEVCYTGQVYDKETGDYYYNARYYSPDEGRFVTVDTYRGEFEEPLSLHLYAYCANNPINFTDPSGHKRGSFAGFGLQLAVSASVSFVSASFGVEIVWFNGNLTKSSPYFYVYAESGATFSKIKKSATNLYKKLKKNPKQLISKPSFSCSLCFFVVYCNKKFTANSYTGTFKTVGASFMGFKGYKSTGGGFTDYGAGKNWGSGGVSFSKSYYWRLSGWGDSFKKIGSNVKKKGKSLKKKVR